MSGEGTGSLDLYLKVGLAISLQADSSPEVAAIVTKVSSERMSARLSRPDSAPLFDPGGKVLIKYWDEGSVVYYWEAEVVDQTDREITLLASSKHANIQRRKSYRVCSKVRFTFTVIDAADGLLNGESVTATTQNLSVGGVAFLSDLPLKVGDKLEMSLELMPNQKVNAVGWVVRCQSTQSDPSRQVVAMEFLQLNPQEQWQLLQFLKSHYE